VDRHLRLLAQPLRQPLQQRPAASQHDAAVDDVASTILDSIVQRLSRGRSNVVLSHLLGLKRDLTPEQAEELRTYAEKRFAA
jgi:hypothetical protein